MDVVPAFKEFRDSLGVDALMDEVEFKRDVMAEFFHQGNQVEVALQEAHCLEQGSQVCQVRVYEFFNLRILHLHRYGFAAGQVCRMNLGEGRGGDGLLREILEDGFQGSAQLQFDLTPDCVEVMRRDLVLEGRKDLDVFGRKDVGSGAQELAALQDEATQLCGGRMDFFSRPTMKSGPASGSLCFRFGGGPVEPLLRLRTEVDLGKSGSDSSGSIQASACFSSLDSGHGLSWASAGGDREARRFVCRSFFSCGAGLQFPPGYLTLYPRDPKRYSRGLSDRGRESPGR